MRARLTVALLTLLVLGLTACDQRGEETAVLLHVPDDPTITMKVWFKVGSQDDPPGKEGLAYLTGELIAEGASQDHSYEEILPRLKQEMDALLANGQ